MKDRSVRPRQHLPPRTLGEQQRTRAVRRTLDQDSRNCAGQVTTLHHGQVAVHIGKQAVVIYKRAGALVRGRWCGGLAKEFHRD
jgi:hypothetical protein